MMEERKPYIHIHAFPHGEGATFSALARAIQLSLVEDNHIKVATPTRREHDELFMRLRDMLLPMKYHTVSEVPTGFRVDFVVGSSIEVLLAARQSFSGLSFSHLVMDGIDLMETERKTKERTKFLDDALQALHPSDGDSIDIYISYLEEELPRAATESVDACVGRLLRARADVRKYFESGEADIDFHRI